MKFQNIGIDKGDIPDLTKAPSSLLDALEQHLASVEGKKGSTSSTPSQSGRFVNLIPFYTSLPEFINDKSYVFNKFKILILINSEMFI